MTDQGEFGLKSMGKCRQFSSLILVTSVDEFLYIIYMKMKLNLSSTISKNKTRCQITFDAVFCTCLRLGISYSAGVPFSSRISS